MRNYTFVNRYGPQSLPADGQDVQIIRESGEVQKAQRVGGVWYVDGKTINIIDNRVWFWREWDGTNF